MEKIFVELLDEGTTVYRPVEAKKISEYLYVIAKDQEYDRDDENWEFEPGTTVYVEEILNSEGFPILKAVSIYNG